MNGPSLYDPSGSDDQGTNAARNLVNAKDRWTHILTRMAADKFMTADVAQQWIAKGFPMPLKRAADSSKSGDVGYLIDLANNNLYRTGVSQAQLDRGGYSIYTTFDKKAMAQMKKAVTDTFKGKLNPKRTQRDAVKGDSHYGQKYAVDAWLRVGGASVKPGDGAVTAIYGGPDFMKQEFDDADNPGVQVGSTFKAFVLAAALQNGVKSNNGGSASPGTGISLDSLYNGKSGIKIKNADGTLWTDSANPKGLSMPNDGGEGKGPVTLKKAMAESLNTVYVQLGMDVGMDKVKAAAVAAGAGKADSSVWESQTPTFALGTSHPGPIRMAAAYATFAASGVEADPYEVSKYVLNGSTTSLKSKPRVAFSSGIADSVTAALRGVIQNGTGEKAKALGWDAAGKTGTTDSKKSAWFVGYTKTLSTAIGLWDQNPGGDHGFWPLIGLTGKTDIYGADYPTEIWTAYMEAALSNQTPVKLPPDPHYGTIQNEAGMSASPTATPTATATTTATSSPTATGAPTITSSPTSTPTGTSTGGTTPCLPMLQDCTSPSTSSSASSSATATSTRTRKFGG